MDVPGVQLTPGLLEQAAAAGEDARLRRLGRQAPDRESLAALQETAREFEAVFLNQLLKAMRETVPDNDLFNSGGATKYYRQLHDTEIARTMAEGRAGLGVADMIVAQFADSVVPQPDAPVPGQRPVAGTPESTPAAPPVSPPPTPAERLGPPAPAPGEKFGPPSPVLPPGHPEPRPMDVGTAADRYRLLAPVAAEAASRARLRGLAGAHSPAAADTLRRFGPEIEGAAAEAGLEPSLVLAVVLAESGGDPIARSPKGALGLMQLMPETASEVGVADATSPAQNLRGGADYLARMLRRYEERLDLALAAYNAGPGNVERAGRRVPPFAETQAYVDRVLSLYRDLGGRRHAGTDFATGGGTTAPDQP